MLILNTILVIESKHMCISFLIFGKCLYFFNFYWGRVTPQCWVNFCCTMNPNSNPIQWSESTICICTSKELYSMLCDDLNGKETPKIENMCIYTTDSGFLGSSSGKIKKSTCNAGDLGSIPGLGRSPGGRYGNPLQHSCLENPHGQRSLEGYSL